MSSLTRSKLRAAHEPTTPSQTDHHGSAYLVLPECSGQLVARPEAVCRFPDHWVFRPLPAGPGAALATRSRTATVSSSQSLAMMIAVGLGLHNFSEGLAIGQSAATGAIALAGVLVIGFALHNITEGFGIAAPMAGDPARPSWGFLFLAGLVGGGPTFLGTMIGFRATSTYIFVLFLTLAAGALIYVISEMFNVGRKMNTPVVMAWGILLGFLAGYSTDLLLTFTVGS